MGSAPPKSLRTKTSTSNVHRVDGVSGLIPPPRGLPANKGLASAAAPATLELFRPF
jgi:hypothetical protein